MQLKAQIGIEHTALLAVVFTILLVGFFYVASTGEEYKGLAFKSLTNNEGNKLIDAIERAPSLGSDGRQTVILNLPEEFIRARLTSPKILVLDLNTDEGVEQMVFVSNYDIVDNNVLSELKPGKSKIVITLIPSGICLSKDGYCGGECGDGIASVTEVCDLNDLKGNVCASFPPYTSGTLVCNSNCSGFDFGACNQ